MRPIARFGTRTKLGILLLVTLVGACSRNPNVRKQKYFASGDRYFSKQDYKAAIIQYSNALKLDARYEPARYQLGQCYLKLGMWQQAFIELSRASELNPGDLKAQITLGNLLLAGREFGRAQDIAKTVLGKDPNNVDAHILLANSYAGLNNAEASLKEMQGAIELAPDRAGSYLNMANIEMHAKDPAQAEQSFKKAVDLDPKSMTARLALGTFYAQQRRFPDAEQQFQSAIQLDPKNSVPHGALARLYLIER